VGQEGRSRERRRRTTGSEQPHSSSLVVVGGISKGKLQPVGFRQQHAHFLVAPVHRGEVL